MKKLLSILLLIVSFNAVAGPSDSALYQKQYLKWRMKVPFWMDNGMYLQKIRLQSTGDSVLVAKGSNGLVGYRSASSFGTTYTGSTGVSLVGNDFRIDYTRTGNIYTGNGLVSSPLFSYNGTPYTGGTGATTKPMFLYEPTGTTAGSTWSTSGTFLGINVPNTWNGDFINLKKEGGTYFRISATGSLYMGSGSSYYLSAGGGGIFQYVSIDPTYPLYFGMYSQIYSPSDGVIKFTDNAVSSFNRLQLGGETSSFPSLQRAGNKMVSRLADNSGNTNLQVKDTVYSSTWNGQIDVPTKNAVYDKIEGLSSLYTYSAGNGLLLGSNTFYRDSLKSTGQHGNSWQNGMYLGSSNNRSINLRTNNLQRATLDSNGRFGINTNLPIFKFHFNQGDYSTIGGASITSYAGAINRSAFFGGTLSGTNYGVLIGQNSSGYGYINGVSNSGGGDFIIQPFASSGNVLVGGSTNAVCKLLVSGGVTIGTTNVTKGYLMIDQPPTATSNLANINLGTAATAFDGTTTGKFVGSATGQYIAVNSVGSVAYNFLQFSKNGVSKFKVDSLGNTQLSGNINFNGIASTDVMLIRNGTKVSARLGDNSADANVTVKDSVYDATAWDANISVPTKNAVRDKIEAMNVTDGTWTPTLTNAGNVAATTARLCYYMRIGTRVMCWGTFAITPSVISTSTTVRMTLPISSTFTTIYQAGGSGIGAGTVNDQYTVNSSTSNPEVFFTTASSTNITSEEISFNFGYTIF